MAATKVTLRQKEISKGRFSLYLDFYPPIPNPKKGNLTRREFLGLYILQKPKNQLEKISNKETLEIAEQIRQKRANSLSKPEIYSEYERKQLKKQELLNQNFIEYFRNLTKRKKGSNSDNWTSALKHLEAFAGNTLRIADLSENWCEEFKEYLLGIKIDKKTPPRLSKNTASSYFNKLKAGLKQAYKDGLLEFDLNSRVDQIEIEEVIKQTLTIEELNKLAKTECDNPLLKKAALFSALTGLPFMEMKNLLWEQIETSKTFGIRIKIRRQKSQKAYFANISQQAYDLLGDRKEPKEKGSKMLQLQQIWAHCKKL